MQRIVIDKSSLFWGKDIVTLTILYKHEQISPYTSDILFPKIEWKVKGLAYLTAVEIISPWPSGPKNGLARTLAKISKTVRPVRPQVLKVPG